MAGYSSTPLWKKLGYKSGLSVYLDNPRGEYLALLSLPPEISIDWLGEPARGVTFVHLFTKEAASLQQKLSDVTEDVIRTIALPLGFVDIKVCAVDEVWSGLKLMIRKTER
jgi:hypothetical protein